MPPQKTPDFIPDTTPDFIPDQPATPAAPMPRELGSLVAAPPQSASDWFENVGRDLRSGGARTIVGRGLGYLQGRGGQGYTGLEAGTTPEIADIMGSVPLGLTRVGKGVSQIGEGHPLYGLGNILAGGLQTATIPASFIAPEAGAMGEEIPSVMGLPTRGHASRLLEDITQQAEKVPVSLTKTEPSIQEFRQYVGTGGKPSAVMSKIGARVSPLTARQAAVTQAKGPVLFPEARQFYTNLSQASARPGFLRRAIESPAMPGLRRQLGGARQALGEDIGSAAETIGRGEDYAKAIREYARASKLRDLVNKAGIVAAEEGLRRSGLLGNLVGRVGSSLQ